MDRKHHPTAVFLFFVLSLHTMVLGLVQSPDSFLSAGFENNPIVFKLILYLTAITVASLYPLFGKYIGLKKMLILGLLCDCLGLFLIYLHHRIGLPSISLYFATGIFGAALLSIFNCLITFTILAYPTRTVIAIIVLFSFGSAGTMLAAFLLNWASNWGANPEIILFVIGVLLLAMWMARTIFVEPPYPKHMEHLRSGTLIWVEMHKRLILFILANILYSITEATFSLWGGVYTELNLSPALAPLFVGIFWLSVAIGQITMVFLFYYLDPRKLFYFLIIMIAFSLIYIPTQTQPSTLLLGFILGGAGCAVIAPIIMTFLEMEVIQTSLASRHTHYLPLIEISVCLMSIGYLFGYGVVDFCITLRTNPIPGFYFYLAPLFILIMTCILFYLNKTRSLIR